MNCSIKSYQKAFYSFILIFVLPATCVSQLCNVIIDRSEKINLLVDSLQFSEGPASDKQGNVYFTDIQTSRIYIWTVENRLKVYKEPSGRANGLRFDASGNLLVCEGASRRVTSISPKGEVIVLADQYKGKKLNSPNDLWIDPKGGIYFTDPRYINARWIWVEKGDGFKNFQDTLFREEQNFRALYYLPPNGRPLRRVAQDFENPNGVVGTLDGKKLYVSDTEKKEVYVFDILSDGSLANRKIFVPSYSDGMTLDEMNNLYLTNGGVDVYSSSGERITTIDLPFKSTNVCFGGRNKHTLFITAEKCLFSIKMKVSGQ